MRFIQSDEELALVVSHEIAHNTLNYVIKMKGSIIFGSIIDALIYITTGVDIIRVSRKMGRLVFQRNSKKKWTMPGHISLSEVDLMLQM